MDVLERCAKVIIKMHTKRYAIRQLSNLTCKQIFLIALICQVVLFLFLLYGNQNLNSSRPNFHGMIPWITARENKTILIWNGADRIETSVFGLGHQPFLQKGCEISDCVVFDNKLSILPLEEYDAIIVHMHELWLTQMPNFDRRAHQRLIFLTQESPTTIPVDVTYFGNLFNWTMTYKLNSDVRLLYGRINPSGMYGP